MVSPDSTEATNGISKSKKTILIKTEAEDVFFFKRSGRLFDFLRKNGSGSVESYLNDEDKFRAAVTLKTINHENSEKEDIFEICPTDFLTDICY